MLTFISFTFKIALTLLLTLIVVFFTSRDKTDASKNKNLVIYALSISSVLRVLYSVSQTINEVYYSFGILSSTLIFLFFVFNNNKESKDYFIIYSLIVLISLGYILSSILLLTVFLLLDNYLVNIEEYFNSESIDFEERVEIAENEEE